MTIDPRCTHRVAYEQDGYIITTGGCEVCPEPAPEPVGTIESGLISTSTPEHADSPEEFGSE